MNDAATASAPTDEAGEPETVPDASELEGLRLENDHLRELLDRAHDVMVTVMNDIVSTRSRIRDAKFRRRYRAAGSCIKCGAEAQRNRTRCLPCARKNTESTKRRVAALRQGTEQETK